MAGISITIGGNFTKLDELKNRANKTANSIKSAFGGTMAKAMFAGVAAAGAAAFAGVTAAVKRAADAGGELSDVMARTGAEGKGLVIMQRAFENAGMAASQVPVALNKMQKALAGLNEEGEPTNKAFERLGLSINELIGLDPVAAFQRISETIAAIEDPAKRASIAMELFGKNGGEMLVTMTDPRAFQTAAKQVGGLGQTLADNAVRLDAVSDSFGLLETKVLQIGAEVAVALLPRLEELSEWLDQTDFQTVGTAIGIAAEETAKWADRMAGIAEYLPVFQAVKKLMEWTSGGGSAITADDQAAGLAMAQEWAKSNDGKSDRTKESERRKNAATAATDAATAKAVKDAEKESKLSENAAKAAEKKAEADKKAADEKAKSRSAAQAEYNMESAILSARLAGDAKQLEALEREKRIREEIARLEAAGFTATEARGPATAKVDAETKADAADKAKEKAEAERKKTEDILRGKLDGVLGQNANRQFESTVGAATSMQRIGGGGGAVSSGLDYARQTADLQREANDLTRQLIAVIRPEPSV
jgi:hypothetical protein